MNDRSALTLEQAGLALGAVLVLLVLVSSVAVGMGLSGIVVVQVVAFAMPPLIMAHWAGGSARGAARLLGVRRPNLRSVLGAALAGISFWYVSLWLVVPVSVKLFGGREHLAELQTQMAGSSLPTVAILLIVSVAPAICEELIHRGALTRALRVRLGPVLAVLASAVLFGLMHIQPARLLPATLFGVVLGYATVVSGTIVPSIVMHLLNNAVVVLMVRGEADWLVEAIADHPNEIGAAALATCALGVWLLWSGRQNTPESPKTPTEPPSATSP